MARNVTAGVNTELAATVKRPIIFYEGVFAASTVRFHSGIGPFTWDSKTWTGAGSLARLSRVAETGSLKASGMTVGLNGLKSAILSVVLSSAQRSKEGKVWVGFLDSSGSLVADPYQVFRGYLDQPRIKDSAGTADIGITYENRTISLQVPKLRRYTHEDQQIDYPGDLGFEFVPAVQEWNEKWGK